MGRPVDGKLMIYTEDDLAEEFVLMERDPHSGYSHLAPGMRYRYVRDAEAGPTVYHFAGSTPAD